MMTHTIADILGALDNFNDDHEEEREYGDDEERADKRENDVLLESLSGQSFTKRSKTRHTNDVQDTLQEIFDDEDFGDEVDFSDLNAIPFPELLSENQCTDQCTDHVWTIYNDGVKSCMHCGIAESCDHPEFSFDSVLNHRKCAACGMIPFGMQLKRECPDMVVYNRIIKNGDSKDTAPLIHAGLNPDDPRDWADTISSFSVSVKLLVDRTYDELADGVLTGKNLYNFDYSSMKQDGGMKILFKGLKINATSKQKKYTKNQEVVRNNDFVLEWSFIGNKQDGSSLLLATVRSQPFTVYSHSKQIDEVLATRQAATNAEITFVIPEYGDIEKPGKYALFGSNFFEGTKIKIGDFVVGLHYHNNGSGYFNVTAEMLYSFKQNFGNQKDIQVPIMVSNDGKNWKKTGKYLTFANEVQLAQQFLDTYDINMNDFTFQK